MNLASLQALFLVVIALFCVARRNARIKERSVWIYYVFLFSGFPALLYQIVWERALFAIYGVNVESVTVVVTGFMLGLGFGSLLGGYLSRRRNVPLLALFAFAELTTAVYGGFSLRLFHLAATYSAGSSLAIASIISFALLLVPTMLMGSTLPLLVQYAVERSNNVGGSLGLLYFANTIGSAAACFLAAGLTMRLFGQSGSVKLAATMNAAVGVMVLATYYRHRYGSLPEQQVPAAKTPVVTRNNGGLSLPIAALLVAVAGFIALAYEIVWYRLFSFWSASNARVFATLLGAYLAGVAVGGLVVHDLTSRVGQNRSSGDYLRLLACFMVVANLTGFAVAPSIRFAVQYHADPVAMLLVAIAAALLGAAFPMICHVSIPWNRHPGSTLSFLYFSNIIGSALGSFLIGFVLMNLWGVQTISVVLVTVGISLAVVLLVVSRPTSRQLAAGLTGCLAAGGAVLVFAQPLFGGLYESMLSDSSQPISLRHLVENRSGVIAVSQNGTVFGGGAYDGMFNVDLVHDRNGLVRVYALSSFDRAPRHVLMIGLASGSWAQVVANHPKVEDLTIVEINAGYLKIIPQYSEVASLLSNPKVRIVVDDGRRWLLAHPQRKFDLIVMNTSFNWREHMSNLLSVQFLQLARRHMTAGGILYYNTTFSPEVLLTGATVFPYALRVVNFLAVSDAPIVVDPAELARTLRDYQIDGRPVLDPNRPADTNRLNEMIAMARRFNSDPSFETPSMEYADSIRARYHGARIVTDDNMGTEWSH
jgi:spermidine synthase